MDRYSDLHLRLSEVMETIVQIQEVNSDLDLNIDDTENISRELNRTTKLMQSRLTQMRMRPLSDLVSRFPRVLADMALDYGNHAKYNMFQPSARFSVADFFIC